MSKHTMKEFFKLYKGHLPMVFFVMCCCVVKSIISIVYPYITKLVTEQLIAQTEFTITYLLRVGELLLCMCITSSICRWIISVRMSYTCDKIEKEMRMKLFAHYNHMSYKFFDNTNSGQLMAVIDGDIDNIDSILFRLPTDGVEAVAGIIGAVVVLFQINIKIACIMTPFLILMFGYRLIFHRRMKDTWKLKREKERALFEYLDDVITGIRTVVSFNRGRHVMKMHKKKEEAVQDYKKQAWQVMYTAYEGVSAFARIIDLVTLVGGAILVVKHEMTIPEFVASIMMVGIIIEPLMQLNNFTEHFQKGSVSFNKYLAMLAVEPEIKDPEVAVSKKLKGDIVFDQVGFSYDNKEENAVFTNLNFKIKQGEYIAFVGTSGVGKSTIAGLIPRYYDIDSGCIMIDDVNIKDYSLSLLRSSIGVVEQSPYMFLGTVYDNITFGKKASMEEVIEAAKKANAHEFISKLPNGYNSEMGEKGVKLSGGQKQRIAIARAFLKNPPIIILDEATSALDNESEREIKNSLEELAKNRTTIVIAHRLSTIQTVDRILFLTKDGIEEEGTHDELMKLGGSYAKLYAASIEV